MSSSVELVGGEQLAASLDRAAGQLGDLRELHDTLGRIILKAAGPLTPRRTGALVARNTAVAGPNMTELTNPTRYAVPVHFGARGKAARPFLIDAAEGTQSEQVAAANKHVQEILDNVKGA